MSLTFVRAAHSCCASFSIMLYGFVLPAIWPCARCIYVAGTLDYLAPEMLTNPNTTLEEGLASSEELAADDILPYGSSVDVWAVGVIAYELVTGAAPFSRKGDTENETMQRIMHWHDTEFPGSLTQQWAHFCRHALSQVYMICRPQKNSDVSAAHPFLVF